MVPTSQHASLSEALEAAQLLSAASEVSIQLPDKTWYQFPETSSNRLGGGDQPTVERRGTVRLPGNKVFARARCVVNRTAATIDDVSVTGLGITLRAKLPVGERFSISIADKRASFSAEVIVIWSTERRAGLHFAEDASNVVARSLLRQLVRRVSARGTMQ